jgi:hypothetical protein
MADHIKILRFHFLTEVCVTLDLLLFEVVEI